MSEYIFEVEYDTLNGTFSQKRKEEVVRCRDCKRYRPKEGAALSCRFEFGNLIQWRSAEPNGFCAWGERMDG